MGTYREDELHRLWEREIAIYREISGICGCHGLQYYMGYGSALGAVRHKGFIPWDDDIDVCMPRKDYEAFLQYAEEELADEFEILGIGYTKGYVLPFGKIAEKKSTFVEETDTNRKYHSGIFVDIFPLDAAAPGKKEDKKQRQSCWRWGRACVLAEYGEVKLPEGMNPLIAAAARAACRMIHGGMRLAGLGTEKCYARFLKAARKYETEKPETYTQLVNVFLKPEYHPAEKLFPAQQAEFEGMTVPIPADPDRYLTQIYGDYMQIPPAEKRHNHYPAILKFD
jgi:lipopolysaccharide cholinephosphotransferase